MASFYIASSFDNKERVAEVVHALKNMGHTISHDWSQFEHAYLQHAAKHAQLDMEGVLKCENFVGLFDVPLAPLNTYVELGIALALQKHIYIIGNFDTKCIFTRLPRLHRLDTVEEFLDVARGLAC